MWEWWWTSILKQHDLTSVKINTKPLNQFRIDMANTFCQVSLIVCYCTITANVRALRSAGRIYSSRPVLKLIKDIKLRTYFVDELRKVEPDMQPTGVTEAEARPRQPR